MSAVSVVAAGPLLLAIPVAAAAGAVTFLSPCVLPLVPGYLSYVTGMSGTAADSRRRAKASPGDAAGPVSIADPDSAEAAEPGPLTAGAGGTATAVATSPAHRLALVRPNRSRALGGAALVVLGFSVLYGIEGVAV